MNLNFYKIKKNQRNMKKTFKNTIRQKWLITHLLIMFVLYPRLIKNLSIKSNQSLKKTFWLKVPQNEIKK